MVSIYDSVCPAEATHDTAALKIIPSLLEKSNINMPHQPIPLRNYISWRNNASSLEQRLSLKGKTISIRLVEAFLDTAILKKMQSSSDSCEPKMIVWFQLRYTLQAPTSKRANVSVGAQPFSKGKMRSICLAEVLSDTAAPDKLTSTPTEPTSVETTTAPEVTINRCRQQKQYHTPSSTIDHFQTLQWFAIDMSYAYYGSIHTNEVSVSLSKQQFDRYRNCICAEQSDNSCCHSKGQIQGTFVSFSSVSTRYKVVVQIQMLVYREKRKWISIVIS